MQRAGVIPLSVFSLSPGHFARGRGLLADAVALYEGIRHSFVDRERVILLASIEEDTLDDNGAGKNSGTSRVLVNEQSGLTVIVPNAGVSTDTVPIFSYSVHV